MASVNRIVDMANSPQVAAADVIIVYGAGININGCQSFGKDVILFQRHRSGPVYLQYEVISPRFLRQHTDEPAFAHIRDEDVVTDRMDEIDVAAAGAVRLEEHARVRRCCALAGRRPGPSRKASSRNWSGRSGGWTW